MAGAPEVAVGSVMMPHCSSSPSSPGVDERGSGSVATAAVAPFGSASSDTAAPLRRAAFAPRLARAKTSLVLGVVAGGAPPP